MATLLLLLTLLGADDPKAKGKDSEPPEKPAVTRVIDPNYSPQPGDLAYLGSNLRDAEGDLYDIDAFPSIEDFKTYVRLTSERSEANDDAIEKLEDRKKLLVMDQGTEVEVIAFGPVEIVRNERGAGGVVAASVRVLKGEHKGKVLYLAPQLVVRYQAVADRAESPWPKSKSAKGLVKKKTPGEAKVKSDRPAAVVDPAARAASLLKLGKDLEKAGKTKGALDLYRQLIRQYPKSTQAVSAGERIKAIEGM